MIEYIWNKKGKTLSDKTAKKEYGIKQEDIIDGINHGLLQYRENCIYGTPYFRLIRDEVECFVVKKFGEKYLKQNKIKNELLQINRKIRNHKKEIKILEEKKLQLESFI